MNSEQQITNLQRDLGNLRQAFKELVAELDALLDKVRRLNAIIKENSK